MVCCVGPSSPVFKGAVQKYKSLKGIEKVVAVGGTILCGLGTLFAGGVGGFAFFSRYVHSREVKRASSWDYQRFEDVTMVTTTLFVQESYLECGPLTGPAWMESVAAMMRLFTSELDQIGTEEYPYEEKRLDAVFLEYIRKFSKNVDYTINYGFIEKRDLKEGSYVYVRADLHGELRSLVENLNGLKELGYLDGSFRCREDVILVFLGDFTDRGRNGLEVLLLLAALKMENPDQVYLIRGNHECVTVNDQYLDRDPNMRRYLQRHDSTRGREILTAFYETLPLTVYISQKGRDAPREYVQFTHGAFEIRQDPQPLLDDANDRAFRLVPIKQEFSRWINEIEIDPWIDYDEERIRARVSLDSKREKRAKLMVAVKRVRELAAGESARADLDNCYQWGDVAEQTSLGDVSFRGWGISAYDIKLCFRLYSHKVSCDKICRSHKIKMLLKGHNHQYVHYTVSGKIVAIMLPVAMDGSYKMVFPHQMDTAYLLRVAPKVKNWAKEGLQRAPRTSKTWRTKTVLIGDCEV